MIDTIEHKLYCSIAGHPPFIHYITIQARLIRSSRIFISELIILQSNIETIPLAKGDRILLFIDGIYEIIGDNMHIIGVEYIEDYVRKNPTAAPADLLDHLIDHLKQKFDSKP